MKTLADPNKSSFHWLRVLATFVGVLLDLIELAQISINLFQWACLKLR
ncbi:hypothetical protein [Tardiphaga robiniae]|nr:hypothetical protein [Tardiphaga robiniae]NUU40387.1 hypothetical protein [Tardiphaga robiniae]